MYHLKCLSITRGKVTEMNNILVANNHLFELGGSETFTYALIEELTRRGSYNVDYFTFKKGIVSQKIESNLGVKFLSRDKYDLILANHNTCVDKLYDRGFIIQTCHGIFPELEQPSNKADAFVSISQEVQDYLTLKGYSSRIILNGINLERFKPTYPISIKLKTILSLCHSEEANEILENICRKKNYKFLKAFKYKNPVWNIEELINRSDLIVGLGRSAYESMACGRPIVIFDKRNYFNSYADGYIRNILGFSLMNNCSGRYSEKILSEEELSLEFDKYNSKDSEFYRSFAIRHLNIREKVDEYFAYRESILANENKIKTQLIIRIAKHTIGKNWLKRIVKLKSRKNQQE